MSMPILSATIFISLTRPIFTAQLYVLQQFGHFSCACAADRHQCADGMLIECLPQLKADWCHAADYLGDIMGAIVWVPGSSRSGENTSAQFWPGVKPIASRRGGDFFVCCAKGQVVPIKAEQLAGSEVWEYCFYSVDHKAQVGLAVCVERSGRI